MLPEPAAINTDGADGIHHFVRFLSKFGPNIAFRPFSRPCRTCKPLPSNAYFLRRNGLAQPQLETAPVIFGLSRTVFFAGLIATAGAAGGLWYVMSEDERSAPVAQRESVTRQDAAPVAGRGAGACGPDGARSRRSGKRSEPGPSKTSPLTGRGRQVRPMRKPNLATAFEGVPQDAVSQSDAGTAQIETPIEENVNRPRRSRAPAPGKAEPENRAAAPAPRLRYDPRRAPRAEAPVIAGRDGAGRRCGPCCATARFTTRPLPARQGAFVFIPRPFPDGDQRCHPARHRCARAPTPADLTRKRQPSSSMRARTHADGGAHGARAPHPQVLSRGPEPAQVAEVAAQETTSSEAPAEVRRDPRRGRAR